MPTDTPPVEVTLEPTFLVAASRRTVARADLGAFFDLAHREVLDAVEAAGARVVGPPIAWYARVPDATADVAAAFPVAGLPLGPVTPATGEPTAPVEVLPLTGGRCLATEHVGAYDGMGSSWDRLVERWHADHGGAGRGDFWEVYRVERTAEADPARWRTRLVLPLG